MRACASVGLFRSTSTTSTVPPDSANPSVKPATVVQGDVAHFLVDAESSRHAGFAHALPGAHACLVLGLTDVGEHAHFGGDITT